MFHFVMVLFAMLFLLSGCVGLETKWDGGPHVKGCLSPPEKFDIIKGKSLCGEAAVYMKDDSEIGKKEEAK